jgi:hypothetical protein
MGMALAIRGPRAQDGEAKQAGSILEVVMANKDTRRSKEVRKPKKAKSAPAASVSPFQITPGRPPPASGGKG